MFYTSFVHRVAPNAPFPRRTQLLPYCPPLCPKAVAWVSWVADVAPPNLPTPNPSHPLLPTHTSIPTGASPPLAGRVRRMSVVPSGTRRSVFLRSDDGRQRRWRRCRPTSCTCVCVCPVSVGQGAHPLGVSAVPHCRRHSLLFVMPWWREGCGAHYPFAHYDRALSPLPLPLPFLHACTRLSLSLSPLAASVTPLASSSW